MKIRGEKVFNLILGYKWLHKRKVRVGKRIIRRWLKNTRTILVYILWLSLRLRGIRRMYYWIFFWNNKTKRWIIKWS